MQPSKKGKREKDKTKVQEWKEAAGRKNPLKTARRKKRTKKRKRKKKMKRKLERADTQRAQQDRERVLAADVSRCATPTLNRAEGDWKA